MNTELIKPLAKELATQLNKLVNIPLVSEEDEQAFFEMVVKVVIEMVLRQLGKQVG
jgi:hypothetical protein